MSPAVTLGDLMLEASLRADLDRAHRAGCLRCLNRVACPDGFNRRVDWEQADMRVSRFLDADEATATARGGRGR